MIYDHIWDKGEGHDIIGTLTDQGVLTPSPWSDQAQDISSPEGLQINNIHKECALRHS